MNKLSSLEVSFSFDTGMKSQLDNMKPKQESLLCYGIVLPTSNLFFGNLRVLNLNLNCITLYIYCK